MRLIICLVYMNILRQNFAQLSTYLNRYKEISTLLDFSENRYDIECDSN